MYVNLPRRKVTKLAIVFLVGVCSLFLGSQLAKYLLVVRATDQFRDAYSANPYPSPVLSQMDWAIEFGGKIGRDRLVALSNDPLITNDGQKTAVAVIELIDRDDLRAHVESSIEDNDLGWPAKLYRRWILFSQ